MTHIRTLLSITSFGLIAALSVSALAQETDTSPPSPDFEGSRMQLTPPPAPPPAAGFVETERDGGPPLLFGHDMELGGYVGLDTYYAHMFRRDGGLFGLQGALLFDHRLSLGLGLYGWANPVSGPDASNGDSQHFQTGYGGASLHYSFFFANSPVYLTVGALLGGGAINLQRDHDNGDSFGAGDRDRHDLFAIVQPDVALNANLTHWMRIGVSAGYRLTSGVNRLGFDNGDLNGVMLGGQLQFGRF